MEAFASYLLKSVIWLTGFTVIFFLFLKNERFFLLNRIYLVAGIFTSFFFPLISVHYTVVLPVIRNFQTESTVVGEVQSTGSNIIPDLKLLILVFYAAGLVYALFRIIRQGRSLLRTINNSEIIPFHAAKLIKTPDYASAFSFFSYVFVNPSVTDIETKEIMNHELVHIRQKHWFDLLLAELLCMVQWFNPLVRFYVRFIRQNHEYLADEVALQRTSDPAVYRAVLLNQIVGAPVVSLTNSFNYSLNKKRFNMMKNIISSPYRKMKILLILPVFAIVLYAFAKPDYRYKYPDNNSGNNGQVFSDQTKTVNGIVKQRNGEALPGAIIVIQGTTMGTVADAKGSFKLGNVPDDGMLVVSFVGFKSKSLKPVFTNEMKIIMVRDTVKFLNENISTPPPPPPPPGSSVNADGHIPLYIVDGITVTRADAEKIDPGSIESVNVLKDKSATDKKATDKYGEKGKDGVVEITTKKAFETANAMVPPPPPPILEDLKIISENGETPLLVVDGTVKDIDVNKIDPATIESIRVLKDKSATEKYGEKGKNGVLEITTKKETVEHPFVVVEEMPVFPGGTDAMVAWINANLKYPAEAVKSKITGKVYVNFVVSSSGKVKNVVVSKSAGPALSAEAIRVISSMPDWKPGRQGGKSVDVQMQVPVEFKLN
jgi:TonB family protein